MEDLLTIGVAVLCGASLAWSSLGIVFDQPRRVQRIVAAAVFAASVAGVIFIA